MNAVCVHVDENMDSDLMSKIKLGLMKDDNICNVEMNPKQPHDILVEYSSSPGMPLDITHALSKMGLTPDIWTG